MLLPTYFLLLFASFGPSLTVSKMSIFSALKVKLFLQKLNFENVFKFNQLQYNNIIICDPKFALLSDISANLYFLGNFENLSIKMHVIPNFPPSHLISNITFSEIAGNLCFYGHVTWRARWHKQILTLLFVNLCS